GLPTSQVIMQKNIILGTAGHIDHGKTTLIKALTGINTDRLPEEQERGITIELGFAHIMLTDGTEVGIIDVPGHEKFVHHMVAGVGGMDMVMLVVAADEGIMPQTREHLAICELLGITKGFVALTKIDMVEHEWLELVQEDVMEYLSGTFLENSPVIPVSSISGKGLADIIATITSISDTIEIRQAAGPFRLPIDRVFTIRGFGTVVTGTVVSGSISKKDPLTIIPGNMNCRIRGMQVHGKNTNSVQAGQRAAINLQNIDKKDIHRGMMLTQPETVPETHMIDARCKLIKTLKNPIKNRTQIRLHTSTAEILGRIVLMDRELLSPGEEADVQFRLIEPTANLPGDHFIIRSYSPVITLGGGRILDSEPRKHKRFKKSTLQHFSLLTSTNPLDRLLAWLDQAGYSGLSLGALQRRFPDPSIDLDKLLSQAAESAQIHKTPDKRFVSNKSWNEFKNRLLKIIQAFHQKYPLRPGLSREALRTSIKPQPPVDVLAPVLDYMILEKQISEHKNYLRENDFTPTLSTEQQVIHDELVKMLLSTGSSGTNLKTIQEELKINPQTAKLIFQYTLDSGISVRLPNGLILHIDAMVKLKETLMALMKSDGSVTVASFRDAAGISRKQAVPLLEYFDNIALTRRTGDTRVLRRTANNN
ncbi:selenocysteine-specific translation elongation factor, partial [bacterium]|nr:selenocysteine-specific translation elongation factor [bacterium]